MTPFLVLEGLDGAGTTTQLRLLTDHLQRRGHRVLATHEPTDRPIGQLIRRVLRAEPGAPSPRCLPWLFAADRADHLEGRIEPALRAGTWVLSDRYVPSSLAYQSLAMDFDEVYSFNQSFRVPDLTLFLAVPVHVALERILQRDAPREIFEVEDRLQAVAERYDQVLQRLKDRGDPWAVLDGTLPVDEVHRQVVAAVQERWP